MTKEITTQNQTTVVDLLTGRNWAEEYGSEAFQSNLVGDRLKFIKGEWLAGRDDEEIPLDTTLVAAVHILQSGWIRWEDGRPAESVMGCRAEGFRPPTREALGHNDKAEWEEQNGKPKDPWQRTDTLLLADPSSGRIFTYSASSDGGLQATKGLAREYGSHMRSNPTDIPVVKLGASWYKHPEHGKTYKPTLEVVDWRDVNDVSFTITNDDEAAAAPQSKAVAPQARSVKPAPRVAAKPAPAAKRNNGGKTRY